MSEEITYICKRTVVSTKPVEPGKHHTLSVLDRLMEPNGHLRMLYYFHTPKDRLPGDTIKKLRESLSETLTSYPLVTGRLKRDENGNWMIKCNDAGVRVVEARVKGSVEEWLMRVDKEKELRLVHWEDMFHKPYFWSTFYVQITEFEGGGMAIGLSCSQLLADPICATTFIKAWADTTFIGKMINPPLFHSLPPRRLGNKNPDHKQYTHLINFYKSTLEKTNSLRPTNLTAMTLSFTDAKVRACIDKAGTVTSGSNQFTPFEVLSGLFWVILSKIQGTEEHHDLINMSICLDMRKTLGLGHGYFGNCMVYNKVEPEWSILTEPKSMIAIAAKSIKQAMSKMDNEGIMDLIEWLGYNNCQSLPLNNSCDLLCVNLEGIDPYGSKFEEGHDPIRVSYYIEPAVTAQILILPSSASNRDGPLSRVVMVTLSDDEASKLLEDDLIKKLCPNIVMH